MTSQVVSYREQPHYLRSGDEDLFAILTEPVGTPKNTTVVMFPEGSWTPSTSRNRSYVRLARHIAAQGFPSLRVDYHGVGESTGRVDYFDLNQPHTEDAAAVFEFLGSRDHHRLMLLGSCFGGMTAIASAAKLDDLAGVALLGVPFEPDRGASHSLRWHLAQAFKKETLMRLRERGRWKQYVRIARKAIGKAIPWKRRGSPGGDSASTEWLVDGIIDLIDRRIPLLLMYGIEGKRYQEFLRARQGRLGEALDRSDDLVTVVVTDGEIHGLVTLEAQRLAIDHVSSWLDELA